MLELVRTVGLAGGELPQAAPAGQDSGREVLVTPPVCLTDETSAQPAPFFVDWLSGSQVHPDGGLPLVDAGCVIGCAEDGSIKRKTTSPVKHEGSFDTSFNVRSDGFRICFSGNVSRFARPDNVFGYDFFTCVQKVNHILSHYGLPPLTSGQKVERFKNGSVKYEWTGARFSRLDLTANYQSGSSENAHGVMQYLGTQHAARHNSRTLGAGETVDFGAGSRRQYWKAYIKYFELIKHGCQDQKLIDYCRDNGIVRFEGTLRSNTLNDLGCAFLGDYESGWAMTQLIHLFNEKTEVFNRVTKISDDFSDLPKHLRLTARDYLAGDDLKLSRATFYRHRRELLHFGIDIAIRNVKAFQPSVKVIELKPAQVPLWYQLVA